MTDSRAHHGFTLLELVITLLLMTLALSFFAPMLAAGFRAYTTQTTIRELDNRLRFVLERIQREVRQAREPLLAEGSRLTFLDSQGREVLFELRDGRLRRNGADLAEGVVAVSFVRSGAAIDTRVTLSWQGQTLEMAAMARARNP